jgi:hypothetical protein
MSPSKPEKTFGILKKASLAILVLGFAMFVGRGVYPYIHGPNIIIDTISNGATLTDPMVRISGTALYTKQLLVSGRSLALATDGSFDETILLHPGYNTISVIGQDQFGKTSSKTYALVVKDDSVTNVAMGHDTNPVITNN